MIKHGWGLKVEDESEDETTFDLAYDMLTRQGLNIYEMRAAFRLIREQPQHIPPLEAFKKLFVGHSRHKGLAPLIHVHPRCMPQEWLRERNLMQLEEERILDALDREQNEGIHHETGDGSESGYSSYVCSVISIFCL